MAEPKQAKPKAAASKPGKGPATKPKSAAKPKARAEPPEKKETPEAKPRARPKAKPKAAGAKAKAKAKSGSTSSPAIYTDPALRDRLKEEIVAGDKGGKPGQWSARKAQLLAHEYEKAGGDYKNGKKKKTDAQQHLDSWTEEDWKTSDDKPADRDGGTTRYLPAEAWDQLSPAEKKATNVKKQAGSKGGEQFVANTAAAKAARKSASKSDGDEKPGPAAKPKAARAKPKAKAARAKPAGGGKKASK